MPNRVLPFPNPFRQSLIYDDYFAFRRVVGSLEVAAGDNRDAHRPEIVAHDELIVVDDLKGPSIIGGVVLDRSGDRIRVWIWWQTRHGNHSQHARYGAKPVEDAVISLRACVGF